MRRMSMNTAGAARIGAAGFMNGQRAGRDAPLYGGTPHEGELWRKNQSK